MSRAPVTRHAVRRTALRMFAERGYHGTSLSEVAAELEIRTPSLYNHMSSKQQLLAEILERTSECVLADFHAATDGRPSTVDRLGAAVEVYARRHAVHRHEALVVNGDVAALDEPVRSRVLELRRGHERAVRALIADGVEEGAFSTDHPALASFGILEMCVAIARWFRDDGPLSPDQVATEHARFALRLVGHDGRWTPPPDRPSLADPEAPAEPAGEIGR